ncbi:MAG: 2-phosphosulfolactate phosphatase [Patescibacteria group bacterium]
MEIEILQLIDGAKKASGLTVIIDVFRAFSTACYAFSNGAARMVCVDNISQAYHLKREMPESLLIGEREGKKVEGFDYGNSPTEIEHIDFRGKTLIFTTSAGTQGIINATHAEEIITGSFVNAGAVVKYVNRIAPRKISLVCMGRSGVVSSDEDTECAGYIRNALKSVRQEFVSIIDRLRHSEASRSFFDPQKTWKPEKDFDLCLDLDRFSFILKAERYSEGMALLKKVSM